MQWKRPVIVLLVTTATLRRQMSLHHVHTGAYQILMLELSWNLLPKKKHMVSTTWICNGHNKHLVQSRYFPLPEARPRKGSVFTINIPAVKPSVIHWHPQSSRSLTGNHTQPIQHQTCSMYHWQFMSRSLSVFIRIFNLIYRDGISRRTWWTSQVDMWGSTFIMLFTDNSDSKYSIILTLLPMIYPLFTFLAS